MKWKQSNGKEIDIKDMTPSHLQNCINLVQRRIDWYDDAIYWSSEGDNAGSEGGVTSFSTHLLIDKQEGLNETLNKLKKQQLKEDK